MSPLPGDDLLAQDVHRHLADLVAVAVQDRRLPQLERVLERLRLVLFVLEQFIAGVVEHQRAAVVLKKATEVDPDYLPAFGHLGLPYDVLRNYEDAITAFKRALDLGATELEYYYEIGLSYAYLDRCTEARPWLEKAVELDASAGPAWEGLEMCDKE